MINESRQARVEGRHWVSAVDFDPEATAGLDFPDPVVLLDSTLRKARYTAGATTSLDGFLRIAEALDGVGITQESLNLDWWGDADPNPRELELVREILAGGFGFRTSVYADTLIGERGREVVDLLAGIGTTLMSPGIVPAPTPEAEKVQFARLEQIVGHAADAGIEFTLILAQAGRRDFAQLMRAATLAADLGAVRIDLMDSTSSLHPEAMKLFVRRIRAGLPRDVPLTMHAHDDFGLATADALAAATAGAHPDVSVNGVSYRCGFAALEEVVTALDVLYGVDTGIRTEGLQELADVVMREMGVPRPRFKAVTGEYAYLKSTPGDVLGCLRDGERSFPPVSGCLHADTVGADVRWVWDSLSTDAMARQLAVNLGFDPDPADVTRVRGALDDAVAAIPGFPRWLTPEQAEGICRSVLAPVPA
ncbi:hypothetical protein [Pseudonocardia sp. WMMC193]|uniref:hypothetical protein n=1 Tax=Pseudonocardia sp. WMMC193 TaxID=2911965 RepID=UPI001F44ED78|nr:hypothetical protein [Pseudonocardia sp. WMMC193]MCF7552736.1 hypothetical protein [Pseudonocardia sp. WMMC193]